MRRPLPKAATDVPSTQTGCEITGVCPSPTPTSGPTDAPTDTPTSTPDDVPCPDGHVCTPPNTPAADTTNAYGWFIHCSPPELASCEQVTATGDPDAPYMGTTVDNAFCTQPQSDAANAVLASAGFDTAPGVFHDFTQECGIEPDPPVPTTTPGCTMDVSLGQNAPYPSDDYGVYQWMYGEWSGNGAQCGSDTAGMTRTISCVTVVPYQAPIDLPPVGRADPMKAPGEARTMQASYDRGTASGVMVDGVYRPGQSTARLQRAQFSGGDDQDVVLIPAPLQSCIDNLPAACNSYSGKQANCTYTPRDDPAGNSEWTLPNGVEGSASCSAYAQRTLAHVCLDGSGGQVDGAFCENNIANGGTQNYAYSNAVQRGNFSGCTARWVGIAEDLGCSSDGNPDNAGPTHYGYYNYECVRSDGTILTGADEVACTGDRPSDGAKPYDACSLHYENASGGTCINVGDGGGDNYGYDQLNAMGLQHIVTVFNGDFYQGGEAACLAAGATCCSRRVNNDDSGGLSGQVTTIGTDNDPVTIYGRYVDSDVPPYIGYGQSDHDPSSRYWLLTDPHGYWMSSGGKAKYVQNTYYIPNDDPDPNAAPPNSDGNGGGGGIN